jgi:hypothetical protein
MPPLFLRRIVVAPNHSAVSEQGRQGECGYTPADRMSAPVAATPAQPSSVLASVAPALPPWRLAGSGFVFAFRLAPGFLKTFGFAPQGQLRDVEERVAALVYADYWESPVGPYRELLLAIGWARAGSRRAFTVPKIYVSTEAAATGGAHWGLPKEMAQFQVVAGERGARRVVVLKAGAAEVDLTMALRRGPALPVPALLLPGAWRTLVQDAAGRTLFTRLGGWGRARRARLVDFRSVPYLFPDLTKAQPLAGLQVAGFQLRLPPPERD